MKIDLPSYGALPPHAIPSAELRKLYQLTLHPLAPQNLPALLSSGQLPGLLQQMKQHCENYIRELLPYTCYGVDSTVLPAMQNNWCAKCVAGYYVWLHQNTPRLYCHLAGVAGAAGGGVQLFECAF